MSRRQLNRADDRPRECHSGSTQLAWKPQSAGSEGSYIVFHFQGKLRDPSHPACRRRTLLKVCSLHGPVVSRTYSGELIDAPGSQLAVGVDKDNNLRGATLSDELYSIRYSIALSYPFLI